MRVEVNDHGTHSDMIQSLHTSLRMGHHMQVLVKMVLKMCHIECSLSHPQAQVEYLMDLFHQLCSIHMTKMPLMVLMVSRLSLVL